MRSTLKKVVVVGAEVALALALGIASAAFAYSASSGSPGGSTTSNDITVTGTETTPLFPGGVGGTVRFTASNGGVTPERLSDIHLTTITADGTHTGCATATNTDFSMADVVVGTDGTLAAGATNINLTEAGTLTMKETGTNQNACEGATLTLAFTTS